MGLETKTTARRGTKTFSGKLHVDSRELTFRSDDFKWEVELKDVVSAEIKKTKLVVDDGNQTVSFDVGEGAKRWVDKILNPPNRMKKLGVKAGQIYWLSKGFSRDFAQELKSEGAKPTRQLDRCDIAFWRVPQREQLIEFDSMADLLPGKTNIWIIWPKGSKLITQTDVMAKTKSLGFGPSKTAAFDDGHSSMRFANRNKN